MNLDCQTINANYLLERMANARRLRLLILNSCRDNHFAALMKADICNRAISVTRGLAHLDAAIQSDVLIAYAALAQDGASDGHSPLAARLLDHLATKDLLVGPMFGRVRVDKVELAGGHQRPYTDASLGGEPPSGDYRNDIERMFARLKDFCRIAARCDKLAETFHAAVCIAAIVSYWL